jgi:hypothetical protein
MPRPPLKRSEEHQSQTRLLCTYLLQHKEASKIETL